MQVSTILIVMASVLVVIAGFTGAIGAPEQGTDETDGPQAEDRTDTGPGGPPPVPEDLEAANESDETGG